MWIKLICCVLVIAGGINYCSTAAIPSYIHICHQSDPQLNDCIKNSIEELRPQLRKGIPELDVPPLEPLNVEDIIISRGVGQYHFMLNLTNVQVFGASYFELNKLKLDIDNMIYKMSVTFPNLRLKGDYAVDTRILSLPITSNGQFDANATNCEGVGILKGDLVRDEFEHLHFSDLTIDLKIGDYKLRLDNIVKGDETLNEAINELANSNKEELIKISTPFIENRAAYTLLKIANQIVNNLEYDKVFPK
ncbi:uncharacterized protein [Atheta coriaria]|uniref:uncharacterized protein n=1 Tax=Dalotia coriaria TaxID=877792 RepID=UPI0031F33742